MSYRKHFVFGTLCSVATILAAGALAQQQAQPAQPDATPRTAPQVQQRPVPEPDFRELWRNREAYGRQRMREGRGESAQFSEADRKAFFEARLAAIRAGLTLTDAQQSLWPPVENAIREMIQQRDQWRVENSNDAATNDFASRLKRRGQMMSARGNALTKFADAIKPFYDSLNEEQKRRLALLMRTNPGRGDRSADRDDRRGRMMQGDRFRGWRDDHRPGERRWGPDHSQRGEGRDWRSRRPDFDDDFRGRGRM